MLSFTPSARNSASTPSAFSRCSGSRTRRRQGARPGPAVARTRSGGARHFLQRLVARRMAERVIDNLEPVEVQVHHREAEAQIGPAALVWAVEIDGATMAASQTTSA